MNKFIVIGSLLVPSLTFAQEWKESSVKDIDGEVSAVEISSESGDSKLKVYKKKIGIPALKVAPTERAVFEFSTNSLDQIEARKQIVYKATQGRVFNLTPSSSIGGLTNKVETVAFHGQSSPQCGIVGNMINSDTLTVRYITTGDKNVDVKFKLPQDNTALYNILKLDSTKDCKIISE
ncbi:MULTISPECIES: hypothetical protein [Acinetobacter calcoaceticus/baumannii complex]|uniref:hypothetical protein n=1 Tax=Acinetobacter calcoaceticus/baumannii complex TaxID=909768 RepID=UPI000DAA7A4D|nr:MULTISPECIES: hypothetical protein [Acinetobacter calcoaceticus/baumannii complex]MBP1486419.1 hypothetical protein [Acinetobacter nosocomialis]MDX8221077.1 hypothetical protein [Acinetobacter pittii]PZL87176.1 hypothetical protein DOL91_18465 [Acinetobacter baumannii]WPP73585.1 hypothetical protein SOI73_00270 [Acinetobacter pittii]